MLPSDRCNEKTIIQTIYKSVLLVSRDYYGYTYSPDNNVLKGFMIDVTGHGLATALQTSAISTILNRKMETEHLDAG